MHIDYIANGLGGPSLIMVALAVEGRIPGTVAITSDTGSEKDRLWSNGRRTDAATFYREVVEPLCAGSRIRPILARSMDKDKNFLPPLWEREKAAIQESVAPDGSFKLSRSLNMPLYGSHGGRIRQTCTDKWKIRAIQQTLRILGAKTACGAQGIHLDEAARRVKGEYQFDREGFSVYKAVIQKGARKGVPAGPPKVVKWLEHFYPLVDLGWNRERVNRELDARGIPYLVTSECDMCPYKDHARWARTSPAVIDEIAEVEAAMGGQFFFTNRLVPLRMAIAQMAEAAAGDVVPDFGCGNSVCGV